MDLKLKGGEMRKLITAVLAFAGALSIAYAVGLSGLIINQPGLAYSTRFSFNLSNAAVTSVSATAVYSSASFNNSTFTTGQISTGSFLVADNTILTAAAATNQITVASTSGALGDAVVIPYLTKPGSYVLRAGRDWNYGATTALTATSLRAALTQIPWMASNVVGSVIYTTAPSGAYYNSVPVTTNNSATLTIASATFLGGRDATTVSVNGFSFRAGTNFAIGGSAATTAGNLRTAINARARLSTYVLAGVATSSVTVQSKKVNGSYNFPMTTSNSAAISVLHPTMIGAASASYALGSKNITIPAHGYTTALPLLYGIGSAAAISGLTDQTTYYAIPVDANTLQLASSSGNAQAGTGIVLASSSTLAAAKTYSLAPLAFVAGSTGFKWQVSNDGTTWTDLAVTSITYSTPGSYSWAFGPVGFTYLGLNVTGPTSGGLSLQVTAQGN